MQRLLFSTCLLLAVLAGSSPAIASTRFQAIPPAPEESGWIETVTVENRCEPGLLNPVATLSIGKNPESTGSTCGIRRSFLSFDLASLRGVQVVSADLVFAQGAPGEGIWQSAGRLRVQLLEPGGELALADWDLEAVASTSLAPGAIDHEWRYTLDLTRWVSFVFEGFQADRMRLRLSVEREGQVSGPIPLQGESALQGLRPRLEVRFTDEVLAPVGLAPASAGLKLSDPFGDSFLGLALVNRNDFPNRALGRRWNADGGLVQEIDRGVISANGQQAFVVATDPNAALLSLRGNWGSLHGFFIGGDNRLRKQDGVGSQLPAGRDLFIPLGRRDVGTTTRVFLFRTSTAIDEEVSVSQEGQPDVFLELLDDAGATVGGFLQEFGPSGTLWFDLETVWTAAAQGTYLRLRSGLPVRSFALVGGAGTMRAAVARPAGPVKRLLLPHFALSRTDETIVQLLNPGSAAVTVVVTLWVEGSGEAQEVTFALAPGRMRSVSVSEWLDIDRAALAPDALVSGWALFELQSTPGVLPRLQGQAVYGRENLYATALPLAAEARTETLILQVAQADQLRIFTGLALLNPGAEPAQAVVQVFHPSGTVTGQRELLIPGSSRWLGLLSHPDLFGAGFQQTGGWVRIGSTQPLAAFSIFGDYDLRYYSAIESQGPMDGLRGLREEGGQCNGNLGPVLAFGNPDPREGLLTAGTGNRTFRFRFWDGSRKMSILGFPASGVAAAEWDLSSLADSGITIQESLEATGDPFMVEAVLRVSVPPDAAGIFPLRVRVSDIDECASEFEFLLTVE